MSSDGFYFFKYNHSERDFIWVEGSELDELVMGDLEIIPKKLTKLNYDALLFLDLSSECWFLGYSESLGIVGERTSRRQADSIVRSGIRLPDGYWLKEPNYPLKELADPNLGDLWQSVQSKYLSTDLTGLELDEETGIPKQIKERADRLKVMGHEDALTEAKLELEEAKNRKKAMEREKGMKGTGKSKKASKNSTKRSTKKSTKKSTGKSAKKSTKKPPKKKSLSKKVTTSKPETSGRGSASYLEIASISEYVMNGNTQIVCKGNITTGLERRPRSIVFSIDHLTMREWTEIVVFLSEGNIIEISVEDVDDIIFATSVKI